ncbi:MAG TPA: lipoprotein [Lysobacter sp.]|nr:lipoprotein [Lysobacter sp.]
MNRSLAFATLALALVLAGCGNKGPLVLPTPPQEETPDAPADDAADEDGAPAEDDTTPPADEDGDE